MEERAISAQEVADEKTPGREPRASTRGRHCQARMRTKGMCVKDG
jgi:hypothetical protein